ncbi:putative gustatory receptor 59d [Scaptodrosophila lebanonensis]|uniref:Gustatory receptor n=1 Tax=Drosophila lebanonensis TaxID=7225 RepID=A0A6J2UHX0_DROLE|nr:putative gustatory receptor 59d [Scaptodrosophila lebanonensis]
MNRFVQRSLRFAYGVARILGVMNLEIDFETGRARVTRRTTIYAAVMNVLTFSVLPLMLNLKQVVAVSCRVTLLHEYLFTFVVAIRIISIFVTIISRWIKKRRLLHIIRAVRHLKWRLLRQAPSDSRRATRAWQRGVIIKFMSATLAEMGFLMVAVYLVREYLGLRLILGIFLIFMLMALLNSIIAQYYVALLYVQVYHIILNEQLKDIVGEMRWLCRRQRNAQCMGVFVMKSCILTDRLTELAQIQVKLQKLCLLISTTFGIQVLSVTLVYYMSSIGAVYFFFSLYKHDELRLGWSNLGLAFVVCSLIIYFVDMLITLRIKFFILDESALMSRILEQYTLFSGLDARLEAAFKDFQLQVARNPLKLPVYGLYNMDRPQMMATFVSLLSHSILLIQYDMKNY